MSRGSRNEPVQAFRGSNPLPRTSVVRIWLPRSPSPVGRQTRDLMRSNAHHNKLSGVLRERVGSNPTLGATLFLSSFHVRSLVILNSSS